MRALDLVVLTVYLFCVLLFGAYFSRSQRNVRDYFTTGKNIPWWAVMGSIVATETSTVSVISVPGLAYSGNFSFLQLVFGYLLGRIAVTVIFIPAYFRGDLVSVYEILGNRFGDGVRRFTSLLFLLTRTVADGLRLFATGLVLTTLFLVTPGVVTTLHSWLPTLEPNVSLLILSILIIGSITVIYTVLGGMAAVIWTDVVQLGLYLAGAGLAAIILLKQIPGGWAEISTAASAAGKFQLFDFTVTATQDYTFWSGLIGGAFLTMATHGTDQLIVQRYLCCRNARQARTALLGSGLLIASQFVLFLLIGVMLWYYYLTYAPHDLPAFTVNGQVQTDRIFPYFIVTQLPSGVVGLVVAAIFAAAMSTLSSSLNSSSAATLGDFYMPLTKHLRDAGHYLRVSRWTTVFWASAQVSVALLAIKLSTRVIDEVLGVASFTNGIILGIFFLGTFTQVGQRAAALGIASGVFIMIAVWSFTAISWQWYVLIGSITTLMIGWMSGLMLGNYDRRNLSGENSV
jgi:Na+/proline symporter|tara:strand:- start:502 stop:2043 length:1542 start_codon:yes stop_codon:yes gene_type:complete